MVAWEHAGRSLSERVSVRLYDERGEVRELGTLPSPVGTLKFGVSASGDADVLLWSTREQARSTIKVATRF